jgi:hypothetical protein
MHFCSDLSQNSKKGVLKQLEEVAHFVAQRGRHVVDEVHGAHALVRLPQILEVVARAALQAARDLVQVEQVLELVHLVVERFERAPDVSHDVGHVADDGRVDDEAEDDDDGDIGRLLQGERREITDHDDEEGGQRPSHAAISPRPWVSGPVLRGLFDELADPRSAPGPSSSCWCGCSSAGPWEGQPSSTSTAGARPSGSDSSQQGASSRSSRTTASPWRRWSPGLGSSWRPP